VTIELSPELEQIVKAKVASGIYPNASDFIREAILGSLEWERLKKQKLDEAITIGLEQADRGEFSTRTVQDIIQHQETQKYRRRRGVVTA